MTINIKLRVEYKKVLQFVGNTTERIITRVGVAYCLEDDKDYLIGEIFDV